ncbi:MAG: sortase [Dehalococcoidia bacterium]|nr:MAG: sortase [Dehalococcoidia bacterium]
MKTHRIHIRRIFFARWLIILGLLISLFVSTPLQSVEAATITVDTADDEFIADGDCSLREAVQAANLNIGVDACTAGQADPIIDEIILPSGTYTLTVGTDLVFFESVNIRGAGPSSSVIQATGVDGQRIFRISVTDVTLSLFDLTLENGNCNTSCTDWVDAGGAIFIQSGSNVNLENVQVQNNQARTGGAIHNRGSLNVLNGSVISGNTTWGSGGGLLNASPASGWPASILLVENSTISGNTAAGAGGIGDANGAGSITIRNSTISGNSAFVGGGIRADWSPLTIINSSISGNTATGGSGGGIYVGTTIASITSSTITNNTGSGSGQGISNNGGTVTVRNSIIAGHPGDNDCLDVTSDGYNLEGGTSCNFTGTGDQQNTDPLLDPLADNGGPTQTHALQATSPAIDTIPYTINGCGTTITSDQRGIPRPANGACDIGAYEADLPILTIISGDDQWTDPGTPFSDPLTVQLTSGAGVPLPNWIVTFTAPASGPSAILSDTVVSTDSFGLASVTATANDLTGAYAVIASVDAISVSFALRNGAPPVTLPETGFAPGMQTELPSVAKNNTYTYFGDLWLEIPSLNVQIPIVGVPMMNNKWDLTWLGAQAGWLEGTAFPTWAGNSGITAHAYTEDGSGGPFLRLGELHWGDEVIVHGWGQQYVYEVRTVDIVSPANVRSLRHEEFPWLTMITCRGYDDTSGEFLWRTVVRAVQVNIKSD